MTRHPRFKNKSDIPSAKFWLLIFCIYIAGGLIACFVAYLTREWK